MKAKRFNIDFVHLELITLEYSGNGNVGHYVITLKDCFASISFRSKDSLFLKSKEYVVFSFHVVFINLPLVQIHINTF